CEDILTSVVYVVLHSRARLRWHCNLPLVCLSLSRRPRPPRSTLFPYTTLFRSGGEQRHAAALQARAQRLQGGRPGCKLGAVALAECGELRRIVLVPFAQPSARREVPDPVVELQFRLGDPARPQPVDQDAQAVAA